jgi:hypothetical protein
MDAAVAAAVADLGYADCTATPTRPSFLAADAARIGLAQPGRLRLDDGRLLLELPTTHSLGSAARALPRSLPPVVHVHFHDYELLDRRRTLALRTTLALLARRRRPIDLDELAASVGDDETPFSVAVAAP